MTERVYVIMKMAQDDFHPMEAEVECVVKSLEMAEDYCLEKEKKNSNFIYWYKATFLEDEP